MFIIKAWWIDFLKKDILEEIYYRYEKILKCIPEDIYGLPKLTNTFKQIYHYRICYECMAKWFEAGIILLII